MKLTVLGCSGSMPGPDSAASSYLVESGETSLLLDLGSGAFGPLQRYTDPGALDAVVFSHLHPDHCSDLTALEVWLQYGPGGHRPMRLIGPPGLRERIRELTHACDRTLSENFALETLQVGVPVQVGPIELVPQEALHPVTAFSFAITGPSEVHDGDARLCYTGDTDLCDGVATAARAADLLLAEAAFSSEDEVRGIHLTGRRAGQLAHEAGAGSLLLTHLQPWADAALIESDARAAYAGAVALASPGYTARI